MNVNNLFNREVIFEKIPKKIIIKYGAKISKYWYCKFKGKIFNIRIHDMDYNHFIVIEGGFCGGSRIKKNIVQ